MNICVSSLTEAEWNENLDKVQHHIQVINSSAANIINLTGSVDIDSNQEKVTAMVDKITTNLDQLVDSLLLISAKEDENAIDTIEKLLEGVEIFLDSTNPELERSNEVRNEFFYHLFYIKLLLLIFRPDLSS